MSHLRIDTERPIDTVVAPRPKRNRQRLIIWPLMVLVILMGGYFRFVGQNWDDFSAMHPDERFLTTYLLPLIGGRTEFTDDAHTPTQVLLTSFSDMTYTDRNTLAADASVPIGVQNNTLAEDVAGWIFGADRVRTYDTVGDMVNATTSGELGGFVIGEAEGNVFTAQGQVRQIDSFSSIEVQQLRCLERYPDTQGIGNYFDTQCSPYNPHNAGNGYYAYGTLPVLMSHVASVIVQQQDAAGSPIFDFQGGTLVWRFLSAFFDVGSIIVIYFIGSRLHNRWVGLFAAILYAAAPLAIEKSHYGTVNAITAFFVILGIWAAVGVQQRGRYFYYAVFGIALGASVASRINTVPLAGVVVLAAMVQMVPFLDRNLAWEERQRVVIQAMTGLILAAVVSLITFRVANPYTFMGPSFLGIGLNTRWFQDLASSSEGVSGRVDSAPNWQWVGRASYFYPMKDMLLWGMGIAMGVMAWFAWAWSGFRLLRGRVGALRNFLPFVWMLVYFGWIGNLWVMTMRYFLPIYGTAALLAGWAIYEFWRLAHERDLPLLRGLMLFLGGIFALVPGYYLVSATPQTATTLTAGGFALILVVMALLPGLSRSRATVLGVFVLGFTVLWGAMFTNIYRHQLTRVQASYWSWENIPGDFAMEIDDAPEGTPLINIGFYNSRPESISSPEDLAAAATVLRPGAPLFAEFVAPASGTVSRIYSPHIGDAQDNDQNETLQITVAVSRPGETTALAFLTMTQNFTRDEHILGSPYTFELDHPFEVVEGWTYSFKAESLSGDIMTAGAVVANEWPWDDRLTAIKVCRLPYDITLADDPPPGLIGYYECNGKQTADALVQSLDMDISFPIDDANKRDAFISALEVSDYIGITSNRFYDTVTRNRIRWPMTSRYYEALFSGELGFDLVEVRQEAYELGPLSVADEHLPIYSSPQWLNELEADEAFHVYDHPVVFIFKKSDDYDQAVAAQILNDVSVIRPDSSEAVGGEIGSRVPNVAYWTSLEADKATTALMQSPENEAINEAGATWSEHFDSDGGLATNDNIAVIAWWLVMMIFGFVTWPLLFVAFPRMADRGYGFAKLMGLLIIAWVAWVLGTLHVTAWSQLGIFVLLIALALFSLAVARRHLSDIQAYVRAHWQRLLWMELLTIALFLIFIGVRMTNPDLWHYIKGGEKPMDFAYFNAVLRSTVFPPYDPWFSGGYINYYYFGYVVVGSPVLLLKMVPSFAYNLIVPTLFALTGIGAFSVAFNIVAAMTDRRYGAQEPIAPPRGSAWLAGVAAIVLCLGVGNLDTVRVLVNGVATMGGYQQYTSIEEYYRDQYLEQYGTYNNTSGTLSLPAERETELTSRLGSAFIWDRLSYEWNNFTSLVSGITRGLNQLAQGRTLLINSDRWYWGPTRVLTEAPVTSGGAITEMPYFTFVYGDLHAHMISMPVIMFAMLFVFNEVWAAGRGERSAFARGLAICMGALAVGLMAAINTWDWPSFMVLSTVGLGYAWWLRNRRLNRRSVLDMLWTIGGFLVISRVVALPHTSWYAAVYQSIEPYAGRRTPLWAYFDIHGLFLFLIVSLLIWETARWFREVPMHSLRGKGNWVSAGAMVAGIGTVIAIAMAMMGYQVALIVIPLILWIAALFFRPGQSRAMQYVLVLIGFSLALTLAVEIVVLTGDIGRQNTVFKFYMQVWLMFSVAGGVAFAWLFAGSDFWRNRLRFVWYIPLMLLFVIAAMYPITATRARSVDRYAPSSGLYHLVLPEETMESIAAYYYLTPSWLRELNGMVADGEPIAGQTLTIIPESDIDTAPLTLQGLNYMTYAVHHPYKAESPALISLSTDYNIIRWMQENVVGAPTLIEGRNPASEYTWTSRISINTGLPSVLGWNFHQRQQRTFNPLPLMVQYREGNVNYFYNTTDIAGAVNILRAYDVTYIILAGYERAYYDAAGLDKFALMEEMGLIHIAYTDGNGFVYEVDKDVVDNFALAQNTLLNVLSLPDSELLGLVAIQQQYMAENMQAILDEVGLTEDELLDQAIDVLRQYDAKYLIISRYDTWLNDPQVIYFLDALIERGILVEEARLGELYPSDVQLAEENGLEPIKTAVYRVNLAGNMNLTDETSVESSE
ncbi:glycosyltransferase family 39 protein [Phototrophicus methaneseepsis]|uniref:Glycosyltransferase family 39 protein n=1 Tax=Phototrophicus methaneseepsis TaxID=2710758 RepID=A0A7S8E740_9CHLR|nr:DUF2298 domain-containing protein [Phototrophicus methaneseepsis]QPC81577.1 glycosyltransferase family 39 protein [Phototrophicus methaneseepsis]